MNIFGRKELKGLKGFGKGISIMSLLPLLSLVSVAAPRNAPWPKEKAWE